MLTSYFRRLSRVACLFAVVMNMAIFIVVVVADLIFDRPSLLLVFAQRRRARLAGAAGAATTIGACAYVSSDAEKKSKRHDNRNSFSLTATSLFWFAIVSESAIAAIVGGGLLS